LVFNKIKSLLHIPKEEDEQSTYQEIKEGVFFRGHNLWLLALAMCIACIGLNTNNTAAVIGAMLISPLMGPIVGLGFGFGIGSRSMVQISLYNWGIMVATSLIASSLYFLISPFDFTTDQLNSFKEGSIFDVLLAFFGGLAGFLGITRREAIKVIAGVAVATACIPPLCTAGYGLATLQWEYLAGGLYFYLINCFFIGLGTWILSIVMGYRKAFSEKQHHNKKATFWLSMASLLLIIPSIYLASKKWERETLKRNSNNYLEAIHRQYPELVIIQHEVFQSEGKNYMSLSVLNDSATLSSDVIKETQSLNKDIEIQWHFAPNNTLNEIKLLQRRMDNLQRTMQQQDSSLQIQQDSLAKIE